MLKKQISPKIISFTQLNFLKKHLIGLIFSILVLCFAIGFYIFAWIGPTNDPPQDNVPAPLNVSGTPQTKSGSLTVSPFFFAPILYDLDDSNYFIDPAGSIAGAANLNGNVIVTNGYVRAGGFKSSDGTSGLTRTVTVQSGYGFCTMTFKNGILTTTTCP